MNKSKSQLTEYNFFGLKLVSIQAENQVVQKMVIFGIQIFLRILQNIINCFTLRDS